MTSADKAKQLVHRFYFSLPNNGGFTGPCNINDRWEEGKKCAAMAVDEIINCDTYFKTLTDSKDFTEYWYDVQEEINKL
jgi:hypothetical protein